MTTDYGYDEMRCRSNYTYLHIIQLFYIASGLCESFILVITGNGRDYFFGNG